MAPSLRWGATAQGLRVINSVDPCALKSNYYIDSLDPGLVMQSIQMSTLVCKVNVKTMNYRYHLFHAPFISFLIDTILGDTLFTACNMMHPIIKIAV